MNKTLQYQSFLPRSLSFIPKWLSSSVQTLDTSDSYSNFASSSICTAAVLCGASGPDLIFHWHYGACTAKSVQRSFRCRDETVFLFTQKFYPFRTTNTHKLKIANVLNSPYLYIRS